MPRGPGEGLRWDPLGGTVQDDGRPIGAVVHLAGDNATVGRWSEERRRSIRESREKGTRTLVDWLSRRSQRPAVLVSASGTGIYGDRGDEELPEDAEAGTGFLAEVAQGWEREALRAEDAGIRVVVLRIGFVLARDGGGLARMLPFFRWGLGGPVGTGRQWVPWVHVGDVAGVIGWAIRSPNARGAYNVVAPGLVRQGEFARTLGRALGRPAVLPAPAFGVRLAFGAMVDELLLASTRAVPRRLVAEGYSFRWPDLLPALRDLVE